MNLRDNIRDTIDSVRDTLRADGSKGPAKGSVKGDGFASADQLRSRLSLLDEVLETGEGRFPADVANRAEALASNAAARLGHGTSFTVVALAGATGSGKSSMFNALAGADLAPSSAIRPTTSVARAAVFGEGGQSLLDWLAIGQRHRLGSGAAGDAGVSVANSVAAESDGSDGSAEEAVASGVQSGSAGEIVRPSIDTSELDGLILLDLPDHDSTAAAHKLEVERLVQVVDVFCWVVDPQKYADAALHEEYLQRFAGHGAVTVVALNQIDRLDAESRRSCIADLQKLLADDGFVGVRVVPTSAKTGEGVNDLRRELSARVAERRAVVKRIDADVDWVASELFGATGDATPGQVAKGARSTMVEAAVDVSGIDAAADAVGAAYRYRASLQAGWPPVRWMKRLKPDPLRRLGLGSSTSIDGSTGGAGSGSGSAVATIDSISVRRSSLPAASSLANAALASAGRDLVASSAEGLPELWVQRIDGTVQASLTDLPDEIDRAIGTTTLPVSPARWWTVVGVLQSLFTVALVDGLAWLGVLFALGWFRIPEPPMPKVGAFPLPTLLALAGGLAGFLLSILVRKAASVGGRRRTAAARSQLGAVVGKVVDGHVIDPVNAELAALTDLSGLVRKLQR
jgi:GTP-binding protein EngB required for normal cell division